MQDYDIVIIGAGTAGLTAAVYALRAGKTVLVAEGESFGGQIASSPRVENYPGIASISGSEFADGLVAQALALGAQVELERVEKITPGRGKNTVTTDSGSYSCSCVIIATGAKHRALGLEREEELCGRGVSYCAVCDGAFFKGSPVAVVGGGDSALQSAAFLSSYCSRVTLIHRRGELRGEKALADALASRDNVELALNSRVTALEGEDTLSAVRLTDETGRERRLAVEGLFIAVGQAPDNEVFKDLVQLDERGYIKAGEDCETGVPGIFAAGDCRTKAVRQLTTAAADGSVAALAACRFIDGKNGAL